MKGRLWAARRLVGAMRLITVRNRVGRAAGNGDGWRVATDTPCTDSNGGRRVASHGLLLLALQITAARAKE